MNLFKLLKPKASAPMARDRLQALLVQERAMTGRTDLAAVLQQEILGVIRRHYPIDRNKVVVTLDRGHTASTLAIAVEIPRDASVRG
jgi:cell division topological specificity factor